MAAIPVTLLTGFLGAGKTTLVGRALKDPRFSDTAVVVNEFGEVGLDHLLVEAVPDAVVEMTSGCLCCTVRGDVSRTLLMLHHRSERGELPLFSRLVIETTGLADPAPVIHTLMSDPRLVERYRLAQVVTVVDAVNGLDTLERQPEAVKQVAVADRLVLAKAELATPDGLRRLDARLSGLNPAAPRLQAGDLDTRALFAEDGVYDTSGKVADVEAWLRAEALLEAPHAPAHGEHAHGKHAHGGRAGHAHEDVNRHGDDIRAFCVVLDRPVERLGLHTALELLSTRQGPDLLRVKGIVQRAEDPGRPLVIHMVQHLMSAPVVLDRWPDADHRTRIVFITRGLERRIAQEFFESWADYAPRPG